MRVEDLAREAGTTVRNVRAYQDRGLLPPPRREGRVALYSEAHLARLRLVGRLLDRGYTLANVAELIAAWERGQDVAEMLGLEAVLAAPWSDEEPVRMSLAALRRMFGGRLRPKALAEAIRIGMVAREGAHVRVDSPRLLEVGADLAAAGIPLDAVLAMGARLRGQIDAIAAEFVALVTTHLVDPLGEPIPAADVPRLAEVIGRLRPLAAKAVDAELAHAMERRVTETLGERVDRLVETLRSAPEAS